MKSLFQAGKVEILDEVSAIAPIFRPQRQLRKSKLYSPLILGAAGLKAPKNAGSFFPQSKTLA
ncbi:hypothetical protein IQ241_16725 [Romeria aff. gracilis LEGE 07310]|uniref:Uncharacterized protein n=1 Tax=Vasconcelosia minhoensis LEGE 07310 TaxID=915328 RepID=A0A8J7A887_9CYAN|nr:hypothetical protein [Romeria gracilis]MBE9078917.1 hypothetical protein [Romeria aff. gracilis LEGE 07310]